MSHAAKIESDRKVDEDTEKAEQMVQNCWKARKRKQPKLSPTFRRG